MSALRLAEEVVRASDREHPADAVLRGKLKAGRGVPRSEGAEASRLVFAYYRWKGWLRAEEALSGQIEHASKLARRFAEEPGSFEDAVLARRAVPGWVSAAMETRPGFARAIQGEPRIWVRARAGRGAAVVRALGDAKAFGSGRLGDILEYRGSADLFRTAGFHAGDFELQDLSSIAVGLVCGAEAGETWWDACAGEGGKTLHLSDTMGNRGLIWATDRAEWRLRKLRLRAARAHVFNYRSAAWDGGERLPTRTLFDGVLVDAPCSGVGTWQRNPHARWTTRPEDVAELAEVQKRLLRHAAAGVKPGGRLIYAVCTCTRAETEGVAEGFLGEQAGFAPAPFTDPLRPDRGPAGAVQYWPQDFGGNGLFVAAWRRAERGG